MPSLPHLFKAQASDRPALVALLTAVHLPTEDLPPNLDAFLLAKEEEDVVGSVGLELHGACALLRSLAVAPQAQGTGLGKRLYEAAMQLAAGKGIREVYLVTTSAAPFFEKRGFTKVERSRVPPALGATRQFSGLCPASATVMRHPLP